MAGWEREEDGGVNMFSGTLKCFRSRGVSHGESERCFR